MTRGNFAMIRRRPGFTMIELVVVVAIIAVLIALLLPAVQSSREAARRTQCANNLLQLGIAIENYEATYQVLPPGVIDLKGPVVEAPASYQFGWISRILPYIEQKNIYQNLDFQAGVYSLKNLTARGVFLSNLTCPSDGKRINRRGGPQNFGGGSNLTITAMPDAATTAYAASHNDVEAPIDVKNTGVFFLNSHVRSNEIEDGLGHTIFVGEKISPGDELGWASGTRATLRNTGTPMNRTNLDPTDLSPFLTDLAALERPSSPNESVTDTSQARLPAASLPIPVGGFGSWHPSGCNFLFGDGSVHFLRTNIDQRIYRLLASRADGEPIGDDQF